MAPWASINLFPAGLPSCSPFPVRVSPMQQADSALTLSLILRVSLTLSYSAAYPPQLHSQTTLALTVGSPIPSLLPTCSLIFIHNDNDNDNALVVDSLHPNGSSLPCAILCPTFAQLFASAAPHPFFLPFSFFCQSDDKRSIDTDPMQNHQSRDGTAPLVPLSRVSDTEQLTRPLSVSHHPIVPPHSISPPIERVSCLFDASAFRSTVTTIGNAVLRVRCQHCQHCQQLQLPATLPCSHAAPAQPPNPTRRPIGFRACLSTTNKDGDPARICGENNEKRTTISGTILP